MIDYLDAIAAIRAARGLRNAARDELYARQLHGMRLARSKRKAARGDAVSDPAIETSLKTLRGERGDAQARERVIARRLGELASVPEGVAALRERIAASPARIAASARALGALANALDDAESAEERARAQDAVRSAQAAHAALATSAQRDRDELTAKEHLAAEARRLRDTSAVQRERIAELDEQIDEAAARSRAVNLEAESEKTASAIHAQRAIVDKCDGALRAAIMSLYDARTPQQLIAEWNDARPIALLPVRLETRWRRATANAGPQLWVRIYPDDIGIATHEKVLTDLEVERGQAYWSSVRAANKNADGEAAAWRALADRCGANRAAWVAKQTKPVNWTAAAADGSIALEFPAPPVTKPDAWTIAPHSRVLPDRFVLLAWRGGEIRVTQVGELVNDVVILGPSPLEADTGDASITRKPGDKTLEFGSSFDWIRNFDAAVRSGLGFRVDVTPEDVTQGFETLLVLGLKASVDAADAQHLVEELIDNHHYSREGFAIVPQGTPTNNTDGENATYTRGDTGDEESGVAETTSPQFTPVAERALASDGQRLADFLGIAYDPLLYASGANLVDHADAVSMNRALYAGTLGYYVDHMLNEVVDEAWLGTLRRHFTDHVTGRGPIAAIRVGNQPYGILPTSSLARWQPSTLQRTGDLSAVRAGAENIPDRFEAALLQALRRFDEAWVSVLPNLVHVGSPGDGAANLLAILGLQPASAEFHQRVAYSYDYLRNLDAFAWNGSNYADVMNMAIEGMGARSVLASLGYNARHADGTPKPFPFLLQLIWRRYQTEIDPKQLIDGTRPSEAALIKPYDAAGTSNFIDWLVAHASDVSALEKQDFGGAPVPASVLYLMLRFSLIMEAAHAVRRWLTLKDVSADELVRSRKFLNIGAEPSPSLWEVFKAPAHDVVAAEPSTAALLTFVHSPQQAEAAGQSVQEQLAAVGTLRHLTTARLERALAEHIDTLSYRLDAWETSLFTRRLERQRRFDTAPGERSMGVYLGAYGYLEQVKPAGRQRQRVADDTLPDPLRTGIDNLYTERSNAGYVHAASLGHATAAALLLNGYLTHASSTDPEALAVNLTSGRVQRAQALVDGVRNGQSLEALLGVQFERGLHDWTTRATNPVILDQLKPLFRAKFPILRTRVPQANDASNGAGASEVAEDHQVTNGLTLARTTDAFPYGITELAALKAAQQSAIQAEKAAIADTLDALRDLLTTESAYQLALGNFDRAAGVLRSAGDGTMPPSIEVVDTPRGTEVAFTQRLAVQLTTGAANHPWSAIPFTERARLEPSFNAWLGNLLGAPDRIVCRASALAPDGSVLVVGGARVEDVVTVAELGLQPIDFVYAVRNQVEPSGAAELETRVRYAFARKKSVADDIVVRIAFDDAGGVTGARSFAEALPLADRLRRLIGTARALDGRHFQSASKDAPAPADNPGRIDAPELRARVAARTTAIRALFTTLAARAIAARTSGTAANIDSLRAALLAVANTGFGYALPRSMVGASAAQRDLLADQADALVAQATALGGATDDALTSVDAATNAEQKVSLLADVVKEWMGRDMLLLPQFDLPDAAAAAQADAARDSLIAYARDTLGFALPVEEWLHGAACVRPHVHDFEVVRMLADAARDEPLALSPIQLPFRNGDSWVGVQYPPALEIVHDTVSIVQHLPQGFAPAGKQCGLLIDEWVEAVPARDSVTGITFNFNAPNSTAPQAVLLAVTPHETGQWAWDDLVATVLETFRRAKLRAVEPDVIANIPGIGTLLPAVVAEFSTSPASVSLDYTFAIPFVQASLAVTPGGGG
jgi:hypothetical protein